MYQCHSYVVEIIRVCGSEISNKQTNNNYLLEKDGGTKENYHIHGLMAWHSRSHQCILTAVKSLQYNELDYKF